jgi:hypothetical protein
MAELPLPWSAYLRLQSQLDHNICIDDRNWGLEAGLNRILAAPVSTVSDDDVTRAVSSEARRERNRAVLRRKYLVQCEETRDPRKMLEARSNLRAIRSLVSSSDWAVLLALGEGSEYRELGASGPLRVRVLRLRRDLPRDLSLAA